MATIDAVVEGLKLIQELYPDRELDVGGLHDEILVGPVPSGAEYGSKGPGDPVFIRLHELGWAYDEENEGWRIFA